MFKKIFARIRQFFNSDEKDKLARNSYSYKPPARCTKYTFHKVLDSSRVEFVEDLCKDGLISLRSGVSDLSLGNARYAQIRLLVDNEYILKGMALFSDDIPEGKDVVVYYREDHLDKIKKPKEEFAGIEIELLNDGIDSCIYILKGEIEEETWNDFKCCGRTDMLSVDLRHRAMIEMTEKTWKDIQEGAK